MKKNPPRSEPHPGSPLDNPAFRRWFGDSVVVDENGAPLVVYHGTPDVRGIFEGGFRKSPTRGGVYFATDDVRTAETYTDPHRAWDYQNAEPGVIPLYLSIKNPLVIDAKFKHWRETEQTIRKAMDAGNDGVVILNSIDHYATTREGKPRRDDASTVFAWFSPTQAKSALDGPMRARDINRWHLNDPSGRTLDVAGPNDGSFDPENPDVKKNPPRSEPHPGSPLDNPAFRRWFGDSVVADEDGEPLVVYHGTTAGKFGEFRPHIRKGESLGFGIHFSEDFDFANRYAIDSEVARKGRESFVFSVYLKSENPLIANEIAVEGTPEFELAKKLAGKKMLTQLNEEGRRAVWLQNAINATSPERAQKLIVESGYDSVRYESALLKPSAYGGAIVTGESQCWVVFDPRQIKSATDNDGSFDPENPDVRKNPGRTFIPPQKVADEAVYGLYLRSQMPPSSRCCTPVGLARAKQLKNREPVSVETLKRMRSYFQRHAVDKKGSRWAIDSKGFQAWLLWGGDSGRDWCNRTLEQLRE